ncbi:hypothetical protein KL938_000245 [Ogataea parapolymorpha]|nr:hypothetical protein KL938_000245 [Ogataea parapolymorpha]
MFKAFFPRKKVLGVLVCFLFLFFVFLPATHSAPVESVISDSNNAAGPIRRHQPHEYVRPRVSHPNGDHDPIRENSNEDSLNKLLNSQFNKAMLQTRQNNIQDKGPHTLVMAKLSSGAGAKIKSAIHVDQISASTVTPTTTAVVGKLEAHAARQKPLVDGNLVSKGSSLKLVAGDLIIAGPVEDVTLDFNAKEYPVHAQLLRKYGKTFEDESLDYKCEKYFAELYSLDPDWSVSPHKQVYDEDQLAQIVHRTKHLTTYGHCYLNHSDENRIRSYEKLIETGHQDIDSRVFPYLSRQMPVFVRWTGEQVLEPPKINRYLDGALNDPDLSQISKSKLQVADESGPALSHEYPFFLHYKNLVNGKGVVISCSDRFLNDTLALIRNLRALGTKLPVQIVHRGDLSLDSQWALVNEARKTDVYHPREQFNRLRELIHEQFDATFPKLELWFVDVSRALTPQYASEFPNFYNKLLAYLFNSFDDVVLLDCDVVLFRKPEQLFQLSQYKRSQSVFFKDRSLNLKVNHGFIDFLKRLLPTATDNSFFGINRASYKTLGTRYFVLEYGHYMESGVVAIKRTRYWQGLFVTLYLSLIKPIHENVWGDKELFWLGQSVAGNEEYLFNDYWSAAIGTLTDSAKRASFKSQELCSTHPGHISSDDDRLLWINSGILTCRKTETFENDFDVYNATLGFETKQQLHEYYNSPLRIEHAIIPPDAMYWVDSFDTPREPRQGYIKQYNCAAYLWCAYDKIGGSEFPEHQGKVFRFEAPDTLLFNYVGQVYLGQT